MSAALIGSGVGLGLGATYMAGGLGEVALEHSRTEQMAEAGVPAEMLQANLGDQAAALRLASATGMAAETPAADAETKPKKRRGGYTSELECMTEAVYYEARGETPRGQAAVAQVVMNRVKHPAYPATVCDVVFQGASRRTGCQFSFACDGSMHGRREAQAWTRARRIAARALSGVVLADVGSATHFHTTAVSPAWSPQMRRVSQVGMHVFYKFAPRRKAAPPAIEAPAETILATLEAAPAQPPVEIRLTSAVLTKPPELVIAGAPAPEAAPNAAAQKVAVAIAAPANALAPAQVQPQPPAAAKPASKPVAAKPVAAKPVAPAAAAGLTPASDKAAPAAQPSTTTAS